MACEIGMRREFTASTPAAIDLSRTVYSLLLAEDPSLSKRLLPQYLDYYTTACIWMRMITIKLKNGMPIDGAETGVSQSIQYVHFCVPEPIMSQLKELGNVVAVTGQRLYAAFPTLPQQRIGDRGGFYGVLRPPGPGVDDSLHNLYEEIPCLGVLSEAVMHAVSDAPPGHCYPSVVTYEGRQPNKNLIGFRILGYRDPRAKDCVVGVNKFKFEDFPANTAFNIDFLKSISGILEKTKTFKIIRVNFSKLSEIGAASQLVVCRPIDNIKRQINLRSNIRPTSLSKDSISVFDNAILFCSQLMKDSGPNEDHGAWCMISPDVGLPIPPQWVENCNQRRNLPIQFMQEVFKVVSQRADIHRLNMIDKMVVTKRQAFEKRNIT